MAEALFSLVFRSLVASRETGNEAINIVNCYWLMHLVKYLESVVF